MRGCAAPLVAGLVASMLVGCGADEPAADPLPSFEVDEIADGFDGPTQIAVDAAGRILVAELNGAERDGTGRIVRLDLTSAGDRGAREVLVGDLLVPTGFAIDGDRLWIMEQRRLTVGPYDDPAERTVVLDDLPYNGRSEGTITAVAGGGIVFDTSGSRDGRGLVEGSGTLWYLRSPADTPEPIATGFKHAYAHAALDGERWLVTEISDGSLDGESPPDELVIAARGDDFGYPRCIGDRVPVRELDATDDECAATAPSLAVFEPRATPTSVVVAPWDPDTALVALWSLDEIVAVPIAADGGVQDTTPVPVDVGRPQHLVVDGDRVLVSDHAGGRILSLQLEPHVVIRP